MPESPEGGFEQNKDKELINKINSAAQEAIHDAVNSHSLDTTSKDRVQEIIDKTIAEYDWRVLTMSVAEHGWMAYIGHLGHSEKDTKYESIAGEW